MDHISRFDDYDDDGDDDDDDDDNYNHDHKDDGDDDHDDDQDDYHDDDERILPDLLQKVKRDNGLILNALIERIYWLPHIFHHMSSIWQHLRYFIMKIL